MSRRVVITGMGSINPLAGDVETTWKKLLAGESGIDIIKGFTVDDIRCQIGGELKDFDISKFHIESKVANKMDPCQQVAFAAMFEAGLQAKIPMRHPEEHGMIFPEFEGMKPAVKDPFRMGVMLGIGVGGIKTFQEQAEVLITKGARRVSPFMIPKMITILPELMPGINAMGVNSCYVTACASGTNALGEAFLSYKK